MSGRREASVDVARMLRLTGPGAQALLGIFALTQCVLALTTLDAVLVPWVSVAALLIALGGAALVVRPGAYPLTTGRTLLVLSTVVSSTTMVTWNLPPHGWPGYASWPLGANTFVLIGLGLRGRIAASWCGMLLMTVVSVAWTTVTGQGIVAGVDLMDRNAGTLLIGTMFAFAFQRTARRIGEFHEAERRRAALEAETTAGERERMRQTERLESRVRPVLELIAGPTTLTDGQREHLRVVEASLRDEIRAGALLRSSLAEAVRRARQRGVDLLLLDDSDGSLRDEDSMHAAATWAAGVVDSVEQGQVVIRLRPSQHRRFLSLHVDDGSRVRMLRYPESTPGSDDGEGPAHGPSAVE